jgi:GTP-binding protein YchF
MMRFGITGLAKSGKTTLFNLLCGTEHDTGKFAATIEEVHRGVAHVPEPRLPRVADLIGAPKHVPATIDFLDFAGLSLGAEKESKLLGDLRTVDAIVHVVRAFEDPELPHPAGSIDPGRDAAAQETEMVLNDLIVVENRLPRLEAHIAKARSDELLHEKEVLLKVKSSLEADRPLREQNFDPEELKLIRGYGFLSAKPLLIALNVGEDEIGEMASAAGRWHLGRFAEKRLVAVSPLSAKLEMEIGLLADADRAEFMNGIGLEKLGSERLLRDAYRLLGLITFFTGNEKEARAWPLRRGSSALEAAATVHTDMARGFIRAEVIHYEDFLAAGSFSKARELGTLHVEGRDYVVCDGDIINIRFNV